MRVAATFTGSGLLWVFLKMAAVHRLDWGTVRRAEQHALERWDRSRTPPPLRRLGIDEKYLGRRHKRDDRYVTTAHCATECSWGRRAVAQNRGGVKLKRDDDADHRRKLDGRGLSWWRAQGHVAAGDDAWVYYRVFADAEEFWRFWFKRYVPQDAPAGERYTATGAAFWSADPSRWFVNLLRAGYRGPVRKQEVAELLERGASPEMHPSVREHRKVVERVRAMFV